MTPTTSYGRVQTSGPILHRAGFGVYGQERAYPMALPDAS
jgi:hypothetical protein